jgi:PTH2 family peptidyl-tRNA hydrolase
MEPRFRFKQALVVRVDLKMGRGKIAVQCAHAAVSASDHARTNFPDWWRAWLSEGQRKIALKVLGEELLSDLVRKARKADLPVYLVRDSGLTQVAPGSITCVGIGPAPKEAVDRLTGNLSLL